MTINDQTIRSPVSFSGAPASLDARLCNHRDNDGRRFVWPTAANEAEFAARAQAVGLVKTERPAFPYLYTLTPS